jgi:hypothetical protein
VLSGRRSKHQLLRESSLRSRRGRCWMRAARPR